MYKLYKGDLPKTELDKIRKNKSVAIDTEYMGLKLQEGNLYLVQLSCGDGEVALVQLDPKKGYKCPNLKSIFKDHKIEKIFHYARADMGVIKMNLHTDIKNVFCTKIASKIIRRDAVKHSLGVLVQEICGVKLNKESQLSNWAAKDLTEKQLTYAANDVLYLHEIKEYFEQKLKETKQMKMTQACFNFLPMQIELDMSGLQEVEIFSHS